MSDERCNADLGPLTAKLLEQQREIERLTAERDEARRDAERWRVESQIAYELTKTLTAERDEARRDAERWQADALRLLKERNA